MLQSTCDEAGAEDERATEHVHQIAASALQGGWAGGKQKLGAYLCYACHAAL